MSRRSRKKTRLRFSRVVMDTNVWLNHPRNVSVVHTYLPQYTELRDPTDSPFLAAAVFAGAHCLITRDKDLLVLKEFHDVEIVKPEEFIRLYRQGK